MQYVHLLLYDIHLLTSQIIELFVGFCDFSSSTL